MARYGRPRQLTCQCPLNSFIISNAPLEQVSWWKESKTIEDFANYHVVFKVEDKAEYVGKIFERAVLVGAIGQQNLGEEIMMLTST